MIHIRSIEYAPRPSRIDIKPDPKKAREVHADLRKSITKPKRRRPYPITYSHS